ncbi:hypothetical protein GCM10029964_095130 [Kibdelosporangium lantanae]
MSDENDIFDHPDLRDTDWSAKLRREVRRNRWRRNRTRVLVLVVVAAVAGLVGYVALRPKENRPDQAAPVVQPVPTTPTTPTSVVRVPKVDLAHPFATTPAAGWADGEAGLVVPEATAVNGVGAATVAKALDQARAAVVESHLDRRVIQDGNVDLYAALFAHDAQQEIRDDNGQLRLRIKPGFTLLDVPPKVKGTLSVTAGDKRGQLVVHANLAIAYAFNTDNPDQLRDAMDIVSVTRYDQKYVYLDDSFVKVAQGLWAGDTQSLWYSVACTPSKDHLLAPAYSEAKSGVGAMPDTSAAFDPNAPMPAGNCPS